MKKIGRGGYMYQDNPKSQQQASNTKWNIYNCASRLFQEKGFDKVTIEEIAEASGVSTGLFYYYFSSKQEILAIYHEQLDELFSTYYDEVIAPQKDQSVAHKIEDMTLYICEQCVAWGVNYVQVVYSYMLTNHDFGAVVVEPGRPYFKIMTALFQEGKLKGELCLDYSILSLVRDITILIRGLVVDWCIRGGEENIRDRSRNLLQIFLRGIASKP